MIEDFTHSNVQVIHVDVQCVSVETYDAIQHPLLTLGLSVDNGPWP